jgi:hypothetical protein
VSTTQLFGNQQTTQTVDNLFQLQIDGLSLRNGENDENEDEPDSDEETSSSSSSSSSSKLEDNEHHPSLFGLAHTQSSPLLHSHFPHNPIPSSSSTSALQTNHTSASSHASDAPSSENNNQLLTPAGSCALHDSGAYDTPCVVCVAAPKLFPFPKHHNKPATATIISKASSNGPRKIGPFPVLNNQSAQWQQDNTAIYCGLCRKTFAVLVRRHHCRR